MDFGYFCRLLVGILRTMGNVERVGALENLKLTAEQQQRYWGLSVDAKRGKRFAVLVWERGR